MALLITPGFTSDSWAATQFKYTAALTSTPHINTTQVSYSYTYLAMQMPHILRITSSNILLWGIIQHEEGSTLNLSLSMSIQMICNVLNHSQKKKGHKHHYLYLSLQNIKPNWMCVHRTGQQGICMENGEVWVTKTHTLTFFFPLFKETLQGKKKRKVRCSMLVVKMISWLYYRNDLMNYEHVHYLIIHL